VVGCGGVAQCVGGCGLLPQVILAASPMLYCNPSMHVQCTRGWLSEAATDAWAVAGGVARVEVWQGRQVRPNKLLSHTYWGGPTARGVFTWAANGSNAAHGRCLAVHISTLWSQTQRCSCCSRLGGTQHVKSCQNYAAGHLLVHCCCRLVCVVLLGCLSACTGPDMHWFMRLNLAGTVTTPQSIQHCMVPTLVMQCRRVQCTCSCPPVCTTS
jgi:hypothetical protein